MRLSLCLPRCQNNATSLTSCTRSGCRFLRTVETPAHVLASSFFHSGCHSLRRDINRIHDLRLIFYRAALIPVYVMQKTLWEVADVIEQNLHNCLHHKLAPGPRRPGSRDFSTIARSIRFAAQSGLGGFLAAAALTRHSLWLFSLRPSLRLPGLVLHDVRAVRRGRARLAKSAIARPSARVRRGPSSSGVHPRFARRDSLRCGAGRDRQERARAGARRQTQKSAIRWGRSPPEHRKTSKLCA
jgi:hypothetical protein